MKGVNLQSQQANSFKSNWRRIEGALDQGQRYVVRYTDGAGVRRTFGFAEDTAGCDALLAKIKANPMWKAGKAVDRSKQQGKPGLVPV